MWNIFWKNKWMQSSDFECVDEPVLNEEKIPRFRPHLYSIYMKFHKWITIFDSILSLLHNIKISLVSSSFRYCWWWCGFCAPNTHLNVGLFNIICTLFYVYSYICFPFLFTRMNISQVLWVWENLVCTTVFGSVLSSFIIVPLPKCLCECFLREFTQFYIWHKTVCYLEKWIISAKFLIFVLVCSNAINKMWWDFHFGVWLFANGNTTAPLTCWVSMYCAHIHSLISFVHLLLACSAHRFARTHNLISLAIFRVWRSVHCCCHRYRHQYFVDFSV